MAALPSPQYPSRVLHVTGLAAMTQLGHQSAARAMGQESKEASMALKVVHDGEAPGAIRENCCICRTKTNYWYEPKDIALCEHCAKTTKRAALPTKEEWCAKEDAIFKQENPHWRPAWH